MNHVVRLILLMFILHTLSPWVYAVTRYVDSACGNISNYNPTAEPPSARCSGGSAVSRTSGGDGVALTASGDTLYFRGGTSPSTAIRYGRINNPATGTSASNRTVFSAYPINRTCSGNNPADVRTCCGSTYESVILHSTSGAVVNIRGIAASQPGGPLDRKWIVVEGFIIDGRDSGDNGITIRGAGSLATNPPACDNGSAGPDQTPDNLRFLNNEIRNADNQGLLGEQWNENIEVICNWVHHNGKSSNTDHGLYMGGSNNWIYGNVVEANKRYGIHMYTQPRGTVDAPQCDPFGSGTIIERNRIFANSGGVILGRGLRNMIFRNNLVYSNTQIGVLVTSSNGGSHKIYNNTMTKNLQQGLYFGEFGHNGVYINNIYDGLFIDPAATGVTGTTNFNGDPSFVDSANNDYRLQAGDARINAGTNLTSQGVTEDFDGNARPSGPAFDIGAFEFDSGGGPVQTFDYVLSTEVPQGTDLTITQGDGDVITVTATRLTGTAAAVAFSVTGLPTNATASFSPTSCTPTTTTCTSDMTLTIPNTTPQGSYTLSVRGVSGSLTRTVALNLVVTCN